MYWQDFADNIMSGEVFRVRGDAKDVYSAISSSEWRDDVILCFKLSVFEKSCYLRYISAANEELVHVVKMNRLKGD